MDVEAQVLAEAAAATAATHASGSLSGDVRLSVTQLLLDLQLRARERLVAASGA